MDLLENLSNAVTTIRSNKLRSGLTMLGVIIGVSSVIVMVAIGQGAQSSVTNRIQQLGSNLLIVTPGGTAQGNVRGGGGPGSGVLTNDDIDAIKTVVTTGISGISPEYSGRKQVVVGNQNTSATITGVLPNYETVRNFHTSYGQFLSEENETNLDRVAVIGQTILSTLFAGENPIGKDLRIEDNIFTVIGVMESKGGVGNADNVIFMPLSTAQKRVFGNNTTVSTIYLSVTDATAMDTVKSEVESALLTSHRLTDPTTADFTVLNQADAIQTLNSVTEIFTLLLGGIAGISLIVGGIGVMNIMLVSVIERTREIGIRKAIGARRSDILLQFLTESMMLSIFGGAIGILISIGIIALVQAKVSALSSTSLSISSVLVAFFFSLFVGVFFGIFPAYKASRLKPIDALRFE